MNRFRQAKYKVMVLLLIAAFISPMVHAEVAVIVHPTNLSKLDKLSIARIFLGKSKVFSDGQQALPLNQLSNVVATTEFNQKVLNKSAARLKAYWSKIIFTGKGSPPVTADSNAEVLNLVEKNPNLIGYIEASWVSDKVRVVALF